MAVSWLINGYKREFANYTVLTNGDESPKKGNSKGVAQNFLETLP